MQDADFEISPNPTDGNVTLHLEGLNGMTEIQVFNGQGQKVDAFAVDASLHREMVYQIPTAKNGHYYFVLNSGGKRLARKVMLAR